ncbi:kinase domain-containing protein, partial [Paracoccidioides lutzii Pb01]
MGENHLRRVPSPPMCFPTSGVETANASVLDEERFDWFKKGCYYPVDIGDIFSSKYQIIGKLGFGVTSTVWLACDLELSRLRVYVHLRQANTTKGHQNVTFYKVCTRDEEANQEEFQIYKYLNQGNPSHPGYVHVRKALDIFTIPRPGGSHHCLVQKPMWESFRDLLYRNPNHRFTEDLLKVGFMQVFPAHDHLHTECRLVHTEDTAILESFLKAEMENRFTAKIYQWYIPVSASRRFELPKAFGRVMLSDFGSAVRGDEKRNHDIYEMFASCSGIISEGKHIFHGTDPDGKGYSTRTHLAKVIGILESPSLDMLKREKRSSEFYTEDMYHLSLLKAPSK